MKSIEIFRWHEHLNNMTDPDDQAQFLNEVLLNIYSNFIPNKVKTIRPHQAPWITDNVKNFLRNKDRAYRNFVKSGQPCDTLEGIQKMISEGTKLIEDAVHESQRKYVRKSSRLRRPPERFVPGDV
eukprot:Seg2490.5 transcript_id=Seg2490.5/GoldUCD/mRNA.D3Y31 product="hypothetical protein" protein_id=Seg2490.5/GoldUCD/D3Y31